jgi:hypothetical protein
MPDAPIRFDASLRPLILSELDVHIDAYDNAMAEADSGAVRASEDEQRAWSERRRELGDMLAQVKNADTNEPFEGAWPSEPAKAVLRGALREATDRLDEMVRDHRPLPEVAAYIAVVEACLNTNMAFDTSHSTT